MLGDSFWLRPPMLRPYAADQRERHATSDSFPGGYLASAVYQSEPRIRDLAPWPQQRRDSGKRWARAVCSRVHRVLAWGKRNRHPSRVHDGDAVLSDDPPYRESMVRDRISCGLGLGADFFYGTRDSGLFVVGRFLNSSVHGPDWLTGGTAGPEGSIFSIVALLFCAALIHLRFPKTHYPNRPI